MTDRIKGVHEVPLSLFEDEFRSCTSHFQSFPVDGSERRTYLAGC